MRRPVTTSPMRRGARRRRPVRHWNPRRSRPEFKMARWRKPDPALVAEFEAALPGLPGAERRQMFGCPCAFVNGQLFAGVHEDRLLVRVPDAAAEHPFAPIGH